MQVRQVSRIAMVCLALLAPVVLAVGPRAEAGSAPRLVAIGIPEESHGGHEHAGAVEVRYGDGRTELVRAPDPQTGARFGAAVTVVELTGDERPDILVGAPGRDLGPVAEVGAVYFFRGTPDGVRLVRTIVPGSAGVPVPPQAGAGFGAALDARPGAVTIGMPLWDADDAVDAGAVVTLRMSESLAPVVAGRLLVPGDGTVPGRPHTGDRFGSAVVGVLGVDVQDGPLVVGAPGTTVRDHTGAGAVVVATRAPDGERWSRFTQASAGMPGIPEAGDAFGSAVAVGVSLIWVGAPREDLHGEVDAGVVHALQFDRTSGAVLPGPMFSQDSLDPWDRRTIHGVAEAGDRFGAALATYPPHRDAHEYAVLIGVPGEDVAGLRDAGLVNGILGAEDGLTQSNTAGESEAGDRFGSRIQAAMSSDGETWHVLIGAPGEDDGAGSVVVDNSTIWKQVRGFVERGDHYGDALGWSP